ncbi:uncharacterized protein [Miscanthus floridulus]|uniref:uncharacterized protein n=1 Tax=Miscanthus floridulus TaxID=154761 RepID=UPI00345749A7
MRWISDIQGALTVVALTEYLGLWDLLSVFVLQPEVEDSHTWQLSASGKYSAKSAYEGLFIGAVQFRLLDIYGLGVAPPSRTLRGRARSRHRAPSAAGAAPPSNFLRSRARPCSALSARALDSPPARAHLPRSSRPSRILCCSALLCSTRARARLPRWCCADEAALCARCDVEIHAANKLASKHQRLPLEALSARLPRCDVCQEKAAFIFCVEDRTLFCRDCDEPIHVPGTLSGNHQRYLATGIRVGFAFASFCSALLLCSAKSTSAALLCSAVRSAAAVFLLFWRKKDGISSCSSLWRRANPALSSDFRWHQLS